MKVKLNKTDKTRLSELIDTYMPLGDREYRISDNGGLTAEIKGKRIIWMLGFGKNQDFLEVNMIIIQKIIEQKPNIETVQKFCSDAMGQLVIKNDRSKAIKSLYMAHLVEECTEDDQRPEKPRRKQSSDVRIEIEEEFGSEYPHPIRILKGMSSSEHIAQMLNNSDCIILHE